MVFTIRKRIVGAKHRSDARKASLVRTDTLETDRAKGSTTANPTNPFSVVHLAVTPTPTSCPPQSSRALPPRRFHRFRPDVQDVGRPPEARRPLRTREDRPHPRRCSHQTPPRRCSRRHLCQTPPLRLSPRFLPPHRFGSQYRCRSVHHEPKRHRHPANVKTPFRLPRE